MSPSTRAVIMQWSWYVPTSTTAAWPQHLVSLHVTHQSSILLCPVSRGIVRDHMIRSNINHCITTTAWPQHPLSPIVNIVEVYEGSVEVWRWLLSVHTCPHVQWSYTSRSNTAQWRWLRHTTSTDHPHDHSTIPLWEEDHRIYNHRDERQWHNLSADICLPSI